MEQFPPGIQAQTVEDGFNSSDDERPETSKPVTPPDRFQQFLSPPQAIIRPKSAEPSSGQLPPRPVARRTPVTSLARRRQERFKQDLVVGSNANSLSETELELEETSKSTTSSPGEERISVRTYLGPLASVIRWINPLRNDEGIIELDGYRLGDTLGMGSFARVRKGTHIYSGEEVAIKIVRKKTLAVSHHPNKRRRSVAREISMLLRLNHPHITRVFEVMESSRCWFIVMELVGGGELLDYLVSRSHVSEREVRKMFRSIVSALAHAHARGVCHRDIKPANILLDDNGKVKLVDFGLGRHFNPNQMMDTWCGSPLYACPQIIRHQAYQGTQADMWSLGVTLYLMLVGKHPFRCKTKKESFAKILSAQYDLPISLSSRAKEAIDSLLVVDPEQRATLEQFAKHRWIMQGTLFVGLIMSHKGYDSSPLDTADVSGLPPNGIARPGADGQVVALMGDLGWDVPMLMRDIFSGVPSKGSVTHALLLHRSMHGGLGRHQAVAAPPSFTTKSMKKSRSANVVPRGTSPVFDQSLPLSPHRLPYQTNMKDPVFSPSNRSRLPSRPPPALSAGRRHSIAPGSPRRAPLFASKRTMESSISSPVVPPLVLGGSIAPRSRHLRSPRVLSRWATALTSAANTSALPPEQIRESLLKVLELSGAQYVIQQQPDPWKVVCMLRYVSGMIVFQVEIVQLRETRMHALKFGRVGGPRMDYRTMCQRLLKMVDL